MDLSALNFVKCLVQKEISNHRYDFYNVRNWESYKLNLMKYLDSVIEIGKGEYGDSLVHGTFKLDDLYLQYADIYFDSDFHIPALIYFKDTDYFKDTHIIIPDGDTGKNDPRIIDRAMELAQKGSKVMVYDPAACGETADRPDHETDLNNVCALSVLMGTNLISLEYTRLSAIYHFAVCSGNGSKIHVYAEGSSSPVALIFSLYNKSIGSCHIKDGVLSLSRVIMDMPAYKKPIYYPKGFLKYGDICHVAASLAPSKAVYEGVCCDGSQKFEKFLKGIYGLYDAQENITFTWR